jgi:hypothetical protein
MICKRVIYEFDRCRCYSVYAKLDNLTHHLDRNGTYAAEIHRLVTTLQMLAVDTFQTLPKETYNQIMPFSMDTIRPQPWHALSSLQQRIDGFLIEICRTLMVDMLYFESNTGVIIDIVRPEDRPCVCDNQV